MFVIGPACFTLPFPQWREGQPKVRQPLLTRKGFGKEIDFGDGAIGAVHPDLLLLRVDEPAQANAIGLVCLPFGL